MTAIEVIAEWLADCRPCSCQEEVYSTPENAQDAAEILAALSAAGLVVCGDGEANDGGVKVRVKACRTMAGVEVYISEGGWTYHGSHPEQNGTFGPWVRAYRLVPLDEGRNP